MQFNHPYVCKYFDTLMIWHHPSGPAIQLALPNIEHIFHHYIFVLKVSSSWNYVYPSISAWISDSSLLQSLLCEILPNSWGQNSSLLCVCSFLPPSHSSISLKFPSCLGQWFAQKGELLTESNWMDAVLIKSWVSCLHFPLGIASLALPAKSNQGRIISKEKPNLFIFNFLPFRCQMETGQDIIIQFISSAVLFFILILHSS